MKGLVATTAVLGVLAIGGLPALALTLAAEETGPDTEPSTTLVEDTDDGARPGPPPWAQGRGPGEDRADDEQDDPGAEDQGTPGWMRGESDGPPPGWVRNHPGKSPHGWAVRAWASCLADQAGDREPGEPVDPEGVCGEKPQSPGQARKSTAAPPGQQGRSAAPGQQDRDEPPGQASKPEKTKKPKTG